MIRFNCQECGSTIKTADEAAGRVATCPQCKARLRVPATAEPVLELDKAAPPPPRPEVQLPEAARETIGCILIGLFVALPILLGGFTMLIHQLIDRVDGDGGVSGKAYAISLVTALIILAIAFVLVSASYFTLRARMQRLKRLAPLEGLSKRQLIKFLGPPKSWDKLADGRELVRWMQPGYQVSMVFDRGVCRGIVHRSTFSEVP